jgi:hypothetical protein
MLKCIKNMDIKRIVRAYKWILISIFSFILLSIYGLYKSGLSILNKDNGHINWFSVLSYFGLFLGLVVILYIFHWAEPKSFKKVNKKSISNKSPMLFLTQIGMNNTEQVCQLKNIGTNRIDIVVLTMKVGGTRQGRREGKSIEPGEFITIKNIKHETETMYDVECEVEFINQTDGSIQTETVSLNTRKKVESQIFRKIEVKEIQNRIKNALKDLNIDLKNEFEGFLSIYVISPHDLHIVNFITKICKAAHVPKERIDIKIQSEARTMSEGVHYVLDLNILEE